MTIIALFNSDMWVGVVVINLHEPTASDSCRVGLLILLLHYIHAVFVHTNSLREEIQADIVAIEHHLYRSRGRCPLHTYHAAQLKAHLIAHEALLALCIIGMRKQSKVFALFHTKKWLFISQFDSIRFLIKACPCIITASFDFHSQWRRSRTDTLITSQSHGIEVIRGVEVIIFTRYRFVILRLDIQNGKCS